LIVAALAAAPATAEVAVRVSGGRVDLTATAAPLADVLDRLARQTGMKVVYEGPTPRQTVTLSLHGRTPAETVLAVLEGLGVNFALVADPTGAHVQTLVVAGTATASSSSPSPAAVRSPVVRRPFGPPPPETVEPAFEEAEEGPAPDEEAFPGLATGAEVTDPSGAPMPPDPALPNPTAPGPSVAPPAGPPVQATPGFSPSPFTPQPQPFPPLPPGVPAAPGASPAPEGSAAPPTPPE
jgi:hypothetical protein